MEKDHKVIHEDFGVFSHYAAKAVSVKYLEVGLKDRVRICVGAGCESIYAVKKVKDMPIIQDQYFEKYKILQNIKMYDFSNINRTEECQILKTQHAWLQKNNDLGFTLKGYDPNNHLEFLSNDFYNMSRHKDYILTYSEKHNTILHIDIAKKDDNIKKLMRQNCYNIRPLRTSNRCLDDQPFIYLPVTLHDKHKDEINNQIGCKTCIDSELVVSCETFEDLQLFEKWLKKIFYEIEEMRYELEMHTRNENEKMSKEFFKSIITFMALTSFHLPTFTKNPKIELQEAQKLIILSPEQQEIIYSKNKRKIIKGSFGSGKTIAAQQIIKLVKSNLCNFDFIYYIIHDTGSMYIQVMKRFIETFSSENLIACKSSDLIGDNKSISSVLKYLSQIHKNNKVHLFIEEFAGEILNEEEVERINVLLQNEIFKDSHIVLVCQSMESYRYQIQEKDFEQEEINQFQRLSELAGFTIFNLSYIIRSSANITYMAEAAIPILEKATIKSAVPQLEQNITKVSNICEAANIQEHYGIKLSRRSTAKKHENRQNNSIQYSRKTNKNHPVKGLNNKEQKTSHKGDDKKESSITNLIKKPLTSASVSQSDQSNIAKNSSKEHFTEAFSEHIHAGVTDTDKLLKYFTINAKKYRLETNINSVYKYVGSRNAHSIKGSKPVLYYPFNCKIKYNIFKKKKNRQSYISQIYCISKVLKKIEFSSKNIILICMNESSKNMMRDALKAIDVKWSDDPELLFTREGHYFLLDYTSVRGCEFLHLVLVLPIDEDYLKHNLIDCLNRCTLYLSIIIINRGNPKQWSKTIVSILNEWKQKDLVEIDNEDYLTNVNHDELDMFYKINKFWLKENEKQLCIKDEFNTTEQLLMKDNGKQMLKIMAEQWQKNGIVQMLQYVFFGTNHHIVHEKRAEFVSNLYSKSQQATSNVTTLTVDAPASFVASQDSERDVIGESLVTKEETSEVILWDNTNLHQNHTFIPTYYVPASEVVLCDSGNDVMTESLVNKAETPEVILWDNTNLHQNHKFKPTSTNVPASEDVLCVQSNIDRASSQFFKWRKFGRLIGMLEDDLDQIEYIYTNNYDRVYHCIKTSSFDEKTIDWSQWRERLLTLTEGGEIVDIIEIKFIRELNLAVNSNQAHMCLDTTKKITILAHNADLDGIFNVLPFELTEQCFAVDNNATNRFLNKLKLANCDVLQTFDLWLKTNNDAGFAIKGYDMKKHLQSFTVDYENKNSYKDSYVLVFSVKHGVIFLIDTDPTDDINTAMRNNRENVRYLLTSHQCLIGKDLTFVPVLLYNDSIIQSSQKVCNYCIQLQLVVSRRNFQHLYLLEKWWENVETHIERMAKLKCKRNQNYDIANKFLNSINSFMCTLYQ